jgi:hypothetical protein
MKKRMAFIFLGLLLPSCMGGIKARAATPYFTVSATNVTMSSSSSNGTGLTTFTLTSVNGYSGSVAVYCAPKSAPAGAKQPLCGGSTVAAAYPVAPNAPASGSISFTNTPVPSPAGLLQHQDRAGTSGVALAMVFLVGLGLRRRASRWILLVLLAVGTFTGLAPLEGCGGAGNAVTPGTYPFDIEGSDINTSFSASTTISVTVP